ncbi:Uncharacterized protein FWK35_00027609 [Aphis craccivora]|uniref:Uncharacterized protein n=1 Tax=Aphis craccivora TaxID=307492 RepID=A0A6G0YQB1_APHCR|nr:Uncharacterized protein FWK35_00027609 [Aphis craccivora]
MVNGSEFLLTLKHLTIPYLQGLGFLFISSHLGSQTVPTTETLLCGIFKIHTMATPIVLLNVYCFFVTQAHKGDGVVERSKASVAKHTVAGSNLGHGRHLLSGKSRCLERVAAIPHPGHGRNLRVPK